MIPYQLPINNKDTYSIKSNSPEIDALIKALKEENIEDVLYAVEQGVSLDTFKDLIKGKCLRLLYTACEGAALDPRKKDLALKLISLDADSNFTITHNSSNTNNNTNHSITYPLLCFVCSAGLKEIAEALLAKNANIEATTSNGKTPFMLACEINDIEIAKMLIDKGANIHVKNADGNNALHIACIENRYELATLLIQHKIDVNAQGMKEVTPLRYCSLKGKYDFVKILLENGANPRLQNKSGFTPFILASRAGHKNIVELLLKYGSESNAIDPATKKTVLMIFCDNGWTDLALQIIDTQSDLNAIDPDGETALSIACRKGQKDVVQALLAKGINTNTQNKKSITPLYATIKKGYKEIATLLLENNAETNVINSVWEETVLHALCEKGWTDLALKIIDKQTDIEAKNIHGNSALAIACDKGQTDVVKALFLKGADPNTQDLDGISPLYHACNQKKVDIALLLIKHNANVNITDKDGDTPLLSACHNGLKTVAEKLIKRKANVNAQNKKGRTPLLYTIGTGQKELTMLLIDEGADVNASDKDHNTPLQIACKSNQETLALFLLTKNAQVNAKNSLDHSPLYFACTNNLPVLAIALLEQGATVSKNDLIYAFQHFAINVVQKMIKKASANSIEINDVGNSAFHFYTEHNLETEPERKKFLKLLKLYDVSKAIRLYLKGVLNNKPAGNFITELSRDVYSFLAIVEKEKSSPLIVAYLLQDVSFIQACYQALGKEKFEGALKDLEAKFPDCTFDNLKYAHVTYDATHLQKGAEAIVVPPAPQNIDLNSLPLLYKEVFLDDKKGLDAIDLLLTNIQKRNKIQAAPENEAARLKFYENIEVRLKHILNMLPKQPESVRKTVLKDIAEAANHCAAAYLTAVYEQYNTVCLGKPTTAETIAYESLAKFREMILRKMMRTQNVHEFNLLLELVGKELGIPDTKMIEEFNDAHRPIGWTKELVLTTFWKMYTPSVILNKMIEFSASSEVKDLLFKWFEAQMPKNYREEHYGKAKALAQTMQQQLASNKQIQDSLLESFEIAWNPKNQSIEQAILEDQISEYKSREIVEIDQDTNTQFIKHQAIEHFLLSIGVLKRTIPNAY